MIKLLSRNYSEVEFTPGTTLTKGGLVAAATLGGSLNGFVGFADIAANAAGTVVVKAEKVSVSKLAADTLAFAPGEIVRYNIALGKATKTGSDPAIGYAKKAALAADTEIIAEFDGAMGIAAGETITLSQITDLDDLTVEMDQITDLDDLAFADLADVNAEGVTNNDTLKYDTATSKWIIVAAAD